MGPGGPPFRDVAFVAAAIGNAVFRRPAQGLQYVAARLICVRKMQFLFGGGGTAGLLPEYHGQLLVGNRGVGPEAPVAIAARNALVGDPVNGLGAPGVLHHIGMR